MSVNGLVSHLEQSGEASAVCAVCKEKGDAVACQILLLSLLMDVRAFSLNNQLTHATNAFAGDAHHMCSDSVL